MDKFRKWITRYVLCVLFPAKYFTEIRASQIPIGVLSGEVVVPPIQLEDSGWAGGPTMVALVSWAWSNWR
jgi:hypothetical protein